MRTFFLALLTMTTCLCNGYAQQIEMEQLLSLKNVNPSNIIDICDPEIVSYENKNNQGLSVLLGIHSSGMNDEAQNIKEMTPKKIIVYANVVSISVINGYTFHVADYYGPYGHSRAVTCLDGAMKGYQGVADNGIQTAESWAVEWHKNYFVHYYPKAKVISYPNTQFFEFY